MMSKQLIIGDIAHELVNTRQVLERLPEEHFSWRPHEKSMTLGGLTTHLVNILNWAIIMLESPELDLSTVPPRRNAFENLADALEEFDTNAAKLDKLLADCDEQTLSEEWTLRHGSHIIRRASRAISLRTIGISHMIHHRAQLGVYLRLLDIPVPGLYGPSADEQ